MAFEFKNGQGSMFPNTKKTTDTQPSMRGEFRSLDGKMFEIAAWTKTDKNGNKWLSLSISEPWKPEEEQSKPVVTTPDDGDLPWD